MTDEADRIVVTGVGLNCCLGLNAEDVWQRVRSGECGIGPLTALEQPDARREGGQAPEPNVFYQAGDGRTLREVSFLRMAISEALRQAELDASHWPEPDRIGIVLGTTLAGMRSGGKFLRTEDFSVLQDFPASSTLHHAATGMAIEGFSTTTCAACASGLSAVALGMTLLRRGVLDIVIAGGYDPISEYVYAGFNSMRLVTEGPPLPFSKKRQGMKLGEGSGILVLERARDATQRGAEPLATVLGFGESSDAHHLTQPQPEGRGAARAILAALADAGISPDQIDLICGHATATPHNDAAEFTAYRNVFGDRLPDIPVTAFKSHLGHTLGAAGAVELILALMSMRDGIVAPVANVSREDVEFDGLNLVTRSPRSAEIGRSINLSLGFGGANCCVVMERIGQSSEERGARNEERGRRSQERETSSDTIPRHSALGTRHFPAFASETVCITGVGVIAPECIGNESFMARVNNGDDSAGPPRTPGTCADGPVDEAQLLPLFANARRVRRFSPYVKLLLAAATEALRDAGLDAPGDPSLIEESCAFLGSAMGTSEFTERYYGQVVQEGIDAANPALFAEGVPNIASAQLGLMLNLRGGSQTMMTGRTSGLDALHAAALRIVSGQCERAIVGAAEEYSDLVNRAYETCGLYRGPSGAVRPFGDGKGFVSGAGAVVFVLESEAAARRRGATVLARVERSCGFRAEKSDPRAMARAAARSLDVVGRPEHVVSSANNTWIDRIELTAMDGGGGGGGGGGVIGSIYGHVPEMFSVSSLAALSLVARTGRMPRLLACENPARQWRAADGSERPNEVGILCTDYNGSVAAVRLRIEQR
jgi:3-oxoacyl-[acyl-carrier-protein] synthase II